MYYFHSKILTNNQSSPIFMASNQMAQRWPLLFCILLGLCIGQFTVNEQNYDCTLIKWRIKKRSTLICWTSDERIWLAHTWNQNAAIYHEQLMQMEMKMKCVCGALCVSPSNKKRNIDNYCMHRKRTNPFVLINSNYSWTNWHLYAKWLQSMSLPFALIADSEQ